MSKQRHSARLRLQLRDRFIDRIAELKLVEVEAASKLGLSRGQMSRLEAQEDNFTLNLPIDAAASIGVVMRMTATRPNRCG
jgi:hypothetical protein